MPYAQTCTVGNEQQHVPPAILAKQSATGSQIISLYLKWRSMEEVEVAVALTISFEKYHTSLQGKCSLKLSTLQT
jgi:hypothetical protein